MIRQMTLNVSGVTAILENDLLLYQLRKPLPEYAIQPAFHKCLVVPVKRRTSVIIFHHAAENMAHAGPIQTHRRLLTSCWWHSMQNDVKLILAACDICQRAKTGPIQHARSASTHQDRGGVRARAH